MRGCVQATVDNGSGKDVCVVLCSLGETGDNKTAPSIPLVTLIVAFPRRFHSFQWHEMDPRVAATPK